MSRGNDNEILSIVHQVCCGLDVHKEQISATLLMNQRDGILREEVKEFGTFTDDLYELREWLLENECPVVAMESTGVYWRPVHNVLEDMCEVILVNARHVKKVPGRKTDISDSRWLAGLLRHGLLRGSFIPERHIRVWRDLSRIRKKYVQNLSDYKRRVHKLFESANIKIDSVVSDLFGVTGRNLMDLLVSGHEITLSDVETCAKGTLRTKTFELFKSIKGFFTEHHRFLLVSMLDVVKLLERQIERVHKRLGKLLSNRRDKVRMLMEIPGIDEVSAHAILSETGDTLEQFDTAASLACWAGLCPGNNESAGKRHSGKSPVKKHHLKTIMTEVSWGAVKKKGSYYREKYYRLKARRGSKKAIIAIAHRIIKAVFVVLKYGTPYRELGEDYLIHHNREGRLRNLTKKAAKLGYTLVPAKA